MIDYFFFFFQAEDGIRDKLVTGVQTCALPISGQGGGLALGLAYTVGSGWQIEGLDVGYARAVHAGPVAALSLTARLGSFIDEGAIIGGARGRKGVVEGKRGGLGGRPNL